MVPIRLAFLLFGALSVGLGAPAFAASPAARPGASSPVLWTEVSIASREERPDLERFLKRVLDQETRRANWGARRDSPLEARLAVIEFSVVHAKDIVRVTCTGVGKLQGQSVRSHFSMGGRPSGKAELERQLLGMLGRGIVSRLAEIARATR